MATVTQNVSMRAGVATIRQGEFEDRDIDWEGTARWISTERV